MLKIKRLLPLLAVLMFALLAGSALAADAKGLISLTDAKGAPGDTVSVTLNMAQNPGIIAAVVQVGYDDSVLKLVDVKDGKLLADGLFSDSYDRNPYVLSWDNALSTSNITGTGALATLSFKILDGAKAGDSVITVTLEPGNLFDWQLQNVPFNAVNGKVTVTGKSGSSTGGGTSGGGSGSSSGGGGSSAGSSKVDNTKADSTKTDSTKNDTKANLYSKYTDLAADAWYRSGVEYMLDKGYMNGVAEDTFDLEGAVTRAQFVTILYRYAGSPDVSGLANPFADVKSGAWYANAVIWGANKGVVKGVTANSFDPEAPLTREQLATQLYRYDKAEAPAADNLKGYSDLAKISAYAKDALNWAVGNKIMNGTTDALLAPQSTATRGQTAVLLSRYFTAAAAVPVPTTPVINK